MLQHKPEIVKKGVSLQRANGTPLQIDSQAQVGIGSQLVPHIFYVMRNLNRKIILRRYLLQENGTMIYFDLGALRVL